MPGSNPGSGPFFTGKLLILEGTLLLLVRKMGRPKKSTNIKQRTIYVYVPNEQIGHEWKAAAKNAGVSVSAYVQEAMECYLARNNPALNKETLDERYKKSLEKIDSLREEKVELYNKLERMNTLLDRYEKQLKDVEDEKFLSGDNFNGVRKYNRRLIELFKKERYMNEERILDVLHISPSDVKSIRAIDRQIENLLDYGVIKPQRGGYLWCG